MDFRGILKSRKFIENLKNNNWGNPIFRKREQMGGVKRDFGFGTSKVSRPEVDGAMGPSPAASPETNCVLGLDGSNLIMVTSCSGLSQDNGVGPSSAVSHKTNCVLGPAGSKTIMTSSYNRLSQPNGVVDLPCTKPESQIEEIGGFSNTLNDSEENERDVSNLHTKAISMMLDLVEIQVTDANGGLNPQRHTAVSFNEK
ncbi:hypothetical protein J1N35_045084 [Gossypium stocksii]|uniref:Uncharacterized protein n=1 Tax=Gossypium stocksii TaxID=47602 RepID=A0A9D3UAK9_9ROSI|nr:hypothetical protein J1N35_045084 [Gossypium stocksii]